MRTTRQSPLAALPEGEKSADRIGNSGNRKARHRAAKVKTDFTPRLHPNQAILRVSHDDRTPAGRCPALLACLQAQAALIAGAVVWIALAATADPADAAQTVAFRFQLRSSTAESAI